MVKLELTENVRQKKIDAANVAFAKKLLAFGSNFKWKVQLPKKFGVQVASRKQLMSVNDDTYDQIKGKEVIPCLQWNETAQFNTSRACLRNNGHS